MIRHLFTLIWNRKKSNFLLVTEIFFSFLVLFAVLSLVVYNYRNYNRPLGYQHDNVWQLSLRWSTDSTALNRQTLLQVLQRVRSYPEVEQAAFASNNTPFAFTTMNSSLSYNNTNQMTNLYEVQDAHRDLLKLNLVEGRWFGHQDDAARHTPIIINNLLKHKFFGEEAAVGKTIPITDSSHYQVIGVVDHYRANSEFAPEEAAMFTRLHLEKEGTGLPNSLLLRLKPGTGVAFEEKMVKELAGMAPGWTLEVSTLAKMRANKARITLVPLIALGLVCGFLIFNVALGLFGVLWYNINRRYSEIGLRRAIGAPAGQIYRQFVGEVLVLATFGLLLGLVFAVQFPLLHVFQVEPVVYLIALVGAGVIIYLLAAGCAFYPSRQAASIQPAVALREE